MRRALPLAALSLLLALPFASPAEAQTPAGMQMRVDRSTNAADPDDVPEVSVTGTAAAFTVETGPAAVVWDPSDRATGTYTLSATFDLLAPSDHRNYYGLVFGGGDLGSSSQNYLYFLIAQDGSFLLNHRANNEAVHSIVPRTAHDAVATPGADGTSSNELEVRVGADAIDFMVNGTVVHTQPREGMASRTDGIYGVRVNHRIPGVRVSGLGTGM